VKYETLGKTERGRDSLAVEVGLVRLMPGPVLETSNWIATASGEFTAK
jgi:hypothetical protein